MALNNEDVNNLIQALDALSSKLQQTVGRTSSAVNQTAEEFESRWEALTQIIINEQDKRLASFRQRLQQQLDAGKITQESFNKQLNNMETRQGEAIDRAREELREYYVAQVNINEKLKESGERLETLEATRQAAATSGDVEARKFAELKHQGQLKAEQFRLEYLNNDKLSSAQKQAETALLRIRSNNIRKLQEQQRKIQEDQSLSEQEKQEKLAKIGNKLTKAEEQPSRFEQAVAGENGIFDRMSKGENAVSAGANVLADTLSASSGPIGKLAGGVIKGITNVGNFLASKLEDSVKKATEMYGKYMGKIDTRLAGSGHTYKEIMELMQKNLAVSPYVKETKYIETLNEIVDAGIAYNVEERTMLATMSDKIATTFNALDEHLTRLIRLQQADMTRYALGTEASLTQFFNEYYQDSSYMTSLYDSVASTLIEATSQMTADQATSFNYATQKWLGALYAVGMSESTVNTIAEGLMYLSTGNISKLSSSAGLQVLMASAAEKAGLSYSTLLTGGLYSSDVDKLMYSMVEYLQEIADNTDNQVMKSQWSDIVGITVSDLRAAQNLTAADLTTLSDRSNLGIQGTTEVLENVLSNEYSKRFHISEEMDNVMENAMFTWGMNIAEDTGQYIAYKVSDYSHQILDVLGVEDTTVGNIIQMIADATSFVSGLIGLVETISDAVSSIGNGFGLDLSAWNSIAYNGGRGDTYLGLTRSIENAENNISNQTDVFTGYVQSTSESFSGVDTVMTEMIQAQQSDSLNTVDAVQNFDDTQTRIEATGEQITSINENTSETLDKIYDKLFESQTTPIKVRIESASPEVIKLLETIINSGLVTSESDLKDYLDLIFTNRNSIADSIYRVRNM